MSPTLSSAHAVTTPAARIDEYAGLTRRVEIGVAIAPTREALAAGAKALAAARVQRSVRQDDGPGATTLEGAALLAAAG